MNANLLNIIKRIIAEQGEDILADSKRLKAFFMDYAKDEPKQERVAFGRCIEMGAYLELKNAGSADARQSKKTALADQLQANTGIDKTYCTDAADLLEAAVFGGVPEVKPTKNVCKNCGKELQEEWKACPYCVSAQDVTVEQEEPEIKRAAVDVSTSSSVSKLLRIAVIVALVLWGIYLIPWFVTILPEGEDAAVIILGAILPLGVLAIATILVIIGQRKNNRKMVLIAGIVYIFILYLGIPSAIMCFMAFFKMKKIIDNERPTSPNKRGKS